jgi:hypothetical protein
MLPRIPNTPHLTGYTVAALTGALILPVVYESLGIAGWLADLIRVALALAVLTPACWPMRRWPCCSTAPPSFASTIWRSFRP